MDNLLMYCDQLEDAICYYENVDYKIIEDFGGNKIEYKLHNLRAEIEDECMFFTDEQHILLNSNHVLGGFLLSALIKDADIDDHITVIYFINGSIIITTLL